MAVDMSHTPTERAYLTLARGARDLMILKEWSREKTIEFLRPIWEAYPDMIRRDFWSYDEVIKRLEE